MKLTRITDRNVVGPIMSDLMGIRYSEDFRGVVYYAGDDVAGGVAYNNFNNKVCSMHMVILKPEYVTRDIIREVFEYPFVVCKLEHILGFVDDSNDAAMAFDLRLGFDEVARLPGGAKSGKDLVILSMSKESCRWIRKEKDGIARRT